MKRLFLLALFAVVLQFLTVTAEGCTCGNAGPPCEAYANTAAVFTGTVTSVTENGNYRTFVFLVGRPFKGVSRGYVRVNTGRGGGDCGYRFEIGRKYLVYASKDQQTGTMATSVCTRTQSFDAATEDLNYIQDLPASATKNRLSGTVTEITNIVDRDGVRLQMPTAGLVVLITGERQTFRAMTDPNGAYYVAGLPKGRYTIRLRLSKHYIISFGKAGPDSIQVDLPDHGWVSADIHYQITDGG